LIHVPVDRPAILRNAEKLLRQGKLDLAIAEYLRIVEDQPSDWNTANVLGDMYVRAGKPDRAVEQFVRIADHLYVEGFLPKAAAVYKKVLKLKPEHEHAILQAAEIAGRQGLLADARALFNSIADRRRGRGDDRGVREIVVRLGALDPNDFEARLSGARARVALDDLQGAVADLRALAAYMQEKERPEEARQALQEAAALDPQGADVPSPDPAADDPRLLLKAAEAHLREGNRVEGLPMLERLLRADSERQQDVAFLGWSIAEAEPALGLDVVQLAADAAVVAGDHASAAAYIQEYVTRVPSDIPALVRLVDVCVGGNLEATLTSSRGLLADAYIAAGQGDEARSIAEDLVAREPWERANIERFRRALVLIGEENPDEVIARRLSGEAPFTSAEGPPAAGAESPAPVAAAVQDHTISNDVTRPMAAAPGTPAPINLDQIFEDVAIAPALPSPSAHAEVDLDVDLNGALDELKRDSTPILEKPTPRESADGEYRLGLSLYEAGRVEEALVPLQSASRTQGFRFVAASLLGRIFRDQGAAAQAIDWFERAAQAPAPTPEEGHQLLFDLAQALEDAGETARALAICMELQADAGNYRDVAARIDRLANVRARG
jgi:tetratricopeptide (TPR) repeat protein